LRLPGCNPWHFQRIGNLRAVIAEGLKVQQSEFVIQKGEEGVKSDIGIVNDRQPYAADWFDTSLKQVMYLNKVIVARGPLLGRPATTRTREMRTKRHTRRPASSLSTWELSPLEQLKSGKPMNLDSALNAPTG